MHARECLGQRRRLKPGMVSSPNSFEMRGWKDEIALRHLSFNNPITPFGGGLSNTIIELEKSPSPDSQIAVPDQLDRCPSVKTR